MRLLTQVSEETFTWTKINAFLMALSIAGFFVFIMVYSQLYGASPEFFGVAKATYGRGTFWLLFFLSLAICVLLNFTAEYIRREFFPTPIDVMVERERCVTTCQCLCVERCSAWLELGRADVRVSPDHAPHCWCASGP